MNDVLKGYSTQNENFVINHLPPCRSKPVKALFVFGTQFKIFLRNSRDLLTSTYLGVRWPRRQHVTEFMLCVICGVLASCSASELMNALAGSVMEEKKKLNKVDI